MYTSMVLPIIIGPINPEVDVTITAISAWSTMLRSPSITGSSLRIPETTLSFGAWRAAELSV
jgi:hypothetical protein